MKPKLSLKGRALKYLSVREHSRSELKTKLLRHALAGSPSAKPRGSAQRPEFDDVPELADEPFDDEAPARAHASALAEVDALLDELEALKFLSNERFADSLAHRRGDRFGVLRLKQELKMHKIPDAILTPALEQARLTEHERAGQLWSRKFGVLAVNFEERTRQHRFLASRGFSQDVISKVLKSGFSDEE